VSDLGDRAGGSGRSGNDGDGGGGDGDGDSASPPGPDSTPGSAAGDSVEGTGEAGADPAPDRPTVLLVDDHEDVLAVYAMALTDRYDVRTATTGAAAREALDDAADVDVVVVDRRLPDTTGDDLIERLRETGFDGNVAMVTAVDPGLKEPAVAVDTYLTKPVDAGTVGAAVDDLTGRDA
jgi:CheY-like chemotaxis protein